MDENENKNYSETLNNEIPEGAVYDVFSENVKSSSERTKAASREYLDGIFNGGVSFNDVDILMTRSQYVADVTRLEDYYKAEKKKTAKQYFWAFVVFAIMEIVRVALELLYSATVDIAVIGFGIGNIVYMGLIATVIVFPIIILCIVISTTKRLVLLKRKYNDSYKRLEQRKQDLMQSGQYDASN